MLKFLFSFHLQAANHFSNVLFEEIYRILAVVIVAVQSTSITEISVNFVDIKNAFEWE